MPTTTTTFSFSKPLVGGDEDAWGGYLNTNWDTVDDLLDGTTPIQPNLTEGSWQIGGTAITTTAAELNELGDFAGVFALPTADGTSGQVLQTDGAGALTFATVESLNGLVAVNDASNNVGIVDSTSMTALTTGQNNIALGYDVGTSLTSGNYNTLVGTSINTLSTGIRNVIMGYAAGASMNATDNVSIGYTAGNQAGNQCVSVGNYANVTGTGTANTCLGYFAGYGITTGTGNTCIGWNAGQSSNNFQVTTQNFRIVMGDIATNAYVPVSWTVTSDERDKTNFAPLSQGLDAVSAIETYTFNFDRRSQYYVYDENNNVIEKPTPDGTHQTEQTYVGFKAQQVEQVLNAAGFPSDVVVDTENPEHYKMKETALIPLLINAIKELKQRVETLEQGA